MDFDFSDEQRQLQAAVRRFLEKECPTARVRAAIESGTGCDVALWKDLAKLGFVGAAIEDVHGGAGLGTLELCVIAEELGRSLAPVPVCSSLYLFAEFLKHAGSPAQKARYLPLIASGSAIGTLAYSEGVGEMTPLRIAAHVTSGRLYGAKDVVADGGIANFAVVVAREAGGAISLFIVALDGVTRTPIKTVDPSRGYARLLFDGAPAERLGEVGEGLSILSAVMDRAAVLTAFEQIGGADRALYMARDYALERRAFGRPIGSFQAIKHMLADMYVAATLARSNAYYAAWALATAAADLPVAAAAARVSATQAFQLCSANNIQVHGGMGFTWEFDCHLFYRRSNALALSLGSQTHWEAELIARMRRRNAA
jgi:acyl-CoA dehydrogenase